MIGGTVIKTKILYDRIWVKCEEDKYARQCAIFVQKNAQSEKIGHGDLIWWQGGNAYWTPYAIRGNSPNKPGYIARRKQGVDFEIPIPKIGFSGVGEPLD